VIEVLSRTKEEKTKRRYDNKQCSNKALRNVQYTVYNRSLEMLCFNHGLTD